MQAQPLHFTPSSKHRFHLLDALRGLAALMVVPRHFPSMLVAHVPVYNSFLAVDFFFCLSGFVVAFAYENRLRDRMTLRDFLVARIIRLYPLAILGTLVGILFALLHLHLWSRVPHGPVLAVMTLSLLLLPNYFFSSVSLEVFPFDIAAWSLFFEMVANVAYSVLVRYRLARSWVFVAISASSFIALIISIKAFGDLNRGWMPGSTSVGLARVGFSFFLGVLLFQLYRYVAPRKYRGRSGIIASTVIALVLIATFSISTRQTRSPLFELFAIALILPTIVYIGSNVELPQRWAKPCAFLGDMSYPLYILHVPLLFPLLNGTMLRFASSQLWVRLFAAPAYILLLGWVVSYLQKYFDVPVRKFLSSHYKRSSNQIDPLLSSSYSAGPGS